MSRFNVPSPQLQRNSAIAALQAETFVNFPKSFLSDVRLRFPPIVIDGALAVPGDEPSAAVTGLGYSDAAKLHMFADLATLWGFADFSSETGCSNYYNSEHDWYNAFFGAYAIRSYKPNGAAWGYDKAGNANFKELFDVCEVDYDFITAGAFGCPFEKMCFGVSDHEAHRVGEWDVVEVKKAVAPSGLHNPIGKFPPDPSSYLAFGYPHPELANFRGFQDFAPVKLVGRFYMKRWPVDDPKGRPISIAWGAACRADKGGPALLDKMMAAMKPLYEAIEPLPPPS